MPVGKPLEILIFGTGAVGSTIGWRLAQNPNTRLSVVCRSNYDAVRQQGIQLSTAMWGDGEFRPHRVVRSPREVADVPFDYVVCANKVTSSSESLSFINDLAPTISQKTALVSAQNGVSVEEPLRLAFRNNTILSAVCYISCVQPFPGVVQQVSAIRPHAFHVGTYNSREGRGARQDKARLERFASLDDRFQLVADIQTERWTKQIFNGAWNPVTAISGLNTHQILCKMEYLDIVRNMAQEIYTVAVRLGVNLASDIPGKTIEFARNNPALTPSMLQDARRGKPMEVESLCGNICRQADAIGVQAPTIKAIYQTLLEMNQSFIAPPNVVTPVLEATPMLDPSHATVNPAGLENAIPMQATC
ncbi:2-dehydropantoate 2-reductase-like protein [Saccharata proteae CBS 121410]|uniref:2-dehydropantoate 2-reductase-like protein n=1 Tax=Saccharata proteae CBS 121410 TaxID=1314787 RepID=A0A9P4HV83_9PEZI|nr:2-dehydropantoate 2-reductase-like protein [Saccharata proteae CBS 121410]